MNRKISIALVLCGLGIVAMIAIARAAVPFFGAGLALEGLYFVVLAVLAWRSPLAPWVRVLGLVALTALVSAGSAYLGSQAFGKLGFEPFAIFQNFCVHVVLALCFLGAVWMLDRLAGVVTARRTVLR